MAQGRHREVGGAAVHRQQMIPYRFTTRPIDLLRDMPQIVIMASKQFAKSDGRQYRTSDLLLNCISSYSQTHAAAAI